MIPTLQQIVRAAEQGACTHPGFRDGDALLAWLGDVQSLIHGTPEQQLQLTGRLLSFAGVEEPENLAAGARRALTIAQSLGRQTAAGTASRDTVQLLDHLSGCGEGLLLHARDGIQQEELDMLAVTYAADLLTHMLHPKVDVETALRAGDGAEEAVELIVSAEARAQFGSGVTLGALIYQAQGEADELLPGGGAVPHAGWAQLSATILMIVELLDLRDETLGKLRSSLARRLEASCLLDAPHDYDHDTAAQTAAWDLRELACALIDDIERQDGSLYIGAVADLLTTCGLGLWCSSQPQPVSASGEHATEGDA